MRPNVLIATVLAGAMLLAVPAEAQKRRGAASRTKAAPAAVQKESDDLPLAPLEMVDDLELEDLTLPELAPVVPAGPARVEAVDAGAKPPEKKAEPQKLAQKSAKAPAPRTFRLEPFAAGGWTSESVTGLATPLMRFGVEGGWGFGDLTTFFSLGMLSYQATYLGDSFGPGGVLRHQTVAEQRYDVGLGLNYRVGNDTIEFIPGLSVRANVLQNAVVPAMLGGVAPEAVLRIHFDRAFAFEAGGGYTYNLFFGDSIEGAVLGRPLGMAWYSAGVRYRPAGSPAAVLLGFRGEALAFEHTYRLYNTFALNLGRAF